MATSRYGITDAQKKALGVALQQAMELRGMNQGELAEAMDTTQSVISQWRLGKFLCPPNAVFKLEETLQMPPGYLSQHFNFMPMPSTRKSMASEIETAVLGDPELGDSDKAAVLAMVRQLRMLRNALAVANEVKAAPKESATRTRKAPAKPAAKPRAKASAPKTKAPATRRRPARSVADPVA